MQVHGITLQPKKQPKKSSLQSVVKSTIEQEDNNPDDEQHIINHANAPSTCATTMSSAIDPNERSSLRFLYDLNARISFAERHIHNINNLLYTPPLSHASLTLQSLNPHTPPHQHHNYHPPLPFSYSDEALWSRLSLRIEQMGLIMDQMHLRLAQLEEGKRRVGNDDNSQDDERKDEDSANDKSLKCHKDEKPKSLL